MNDRIYCTLTTKSHLAETRVMAHSLKECEPEAQIFVLLADRIDGFFDPLDEPFTTIEIDELDRQDEVQRMAFYYRKHEFCWGLKARLHEHMMNRLQLPRWVFLDADIVVHHPLDTVWEHLESNSILLSTHLDQAHDIDEPHGRAIVKLENYMLYTGVYNGGLVGFTATSETKDFLKWWRDRLTYYAFENRPAAFGDQYWLPLAASYFDSVGVLRNPGANVAFWNHFERDISFGSDGKPYANGEPLLFFHYSGFDSTRPETLTRHGMVKGLDQIADPMTKLARDYSEKLKTMGENEAKHSPYAFSHFESGEKITREMRQLYFADLTSGKYPKEISPFENYTYFKLRLRRRSWKSFLFKVGRRLIRRIRRMLSRDSEHQIQSWGWD